LGEGLDGLKKPSKSLQNKAERAKCCHDRLCDPCRRLFWGSNPEKTPHHLRKKGCCFAIAFSTDVSDEDALAEARSTHTSEWGRIDTSSLRFV